MRGTSRYVVIVLVWLWAAGAEAGQVAIAYSLTGWAGDNGQPPGDVFAIAQDVEGYLWLGTPAGLVRFDGTQFTRWPLPGGPPLPSGPVHAIVSDPDGSLWVGFGGGGGVVHITPEATVRYTPDDGAPPGVTAMIQDQQGAIWVAGRRGVFRFAARRWTTMTPADGYPGVEASSLYEDRAGRVWVGTAAGVYRRVAGKFELVDASRVSVQALAEDAKGTMWITDPSRLVDRLSGGAPPQIPSAVRLPAGGWRVLHDANGQLWVAAFTGLTRIRNTAAAAPVVERFEYEHRLPGSPRALFEDREKNIWVGMRGGLLRLSQSSFAAVPRLDGANSDGVRTAAVGADGSVWVATAHSVSRFVGAAHTSYPIAQTMALHTDRHGEMWIATSQEIGRLVDGRLVRVPIPAPMRPSRVMALTTDAQDRLWFCSSLRGVSIWDGAHVAPAGPDASVSARACQSIYTDWRDRVWAGFLSGGVGIFEGNTVKVFSEADGLAGGTVLAILEDRTGAMWFSTSSGLSRYASGRFTTITRANAPLVDLVPVLVEDEEGGIWVGINSGAAILRVEPAEMDKVAAAASHHVEFALFDESDGLQQGAQTWQAGVGGIRAADGRLWVATGVGMAIIDPRALPAVPRPQRPRIDAVTVDGRRLQPQPGLTLPSGTSTVAVEFSTINLTSSKLRFRYMLDSVDADWVYADNVGAATYSSLPAGEHRFRVSAASTGTWIEPTVYAFVVSPPFYRTRGFVALAAVSVALLFVTAWWLRLRAVRNQYALVFAERARVSREIHDTLLQSLAAIGLELETIATEVEPAQGKARDALRRLRRQIGHSVRDARESIRELRHNPMQQRSLADALEEMAQAMARARGVPVDLSVRGRPHPRDTDVEIQLLRIGQEAVLNAMKHARPTAIQITLAYEPDRIVLRVSDDGCGFAPDPIAPPAASGEHLGLITMRERAERLGGTVTTLSRVGGGTSVEAAIPVTRS